MQSQKPKWSADRGARALKAVSKIEASIVALSDEDLLDLYDIFSGSAATPLAVLAADEMKRRNLTA